MKKLSIAKKNGVGLSRSDDFNGAVYNQYIDTVSDLSEKFRVITPWSCGGVDDPYTSGIFHSPTGYSFRVGYIEQDNVYVLFASKGSSNLRGTLGEGESVHPSEDGITKTYPIAAYRLKDSEGNKDKIFGMISEAMMKFDGELPDRSRHTKTVMVNFSSTPVFRHDIDGSYYGEGIEVAVNMKRYDVMRHEKGIGRVDHDLSVYRDEGSFKFNRYAAHGDMSGHGSIRRFLSKVGYSFRHNFISDGLSHISHSVTTDGSYLQRRYAMDVERRHIDMHKYEQHDIHMGRNVGYCVAAKVGSAFNYVHNRPTVLAANAVAVAYVYTNYPQLGFVAATGSALAHFAVHESSSEVMKNLGGAYGRVKRKFFGESVHEKCFDENIAPMYKKGYNNILFGRHEVHKFLPHADTQKLRSQDVVYLTPREVASLNEKVGAIYVDDLNHYALDAFILKQHQKNLPLKTYWLDRFTRGLQVDNGLTDIVHKSPGGEGYTIYARLDKYLCVNKGLDMPEGYKQQLGDDIIKLSVHKKDGNWVFDGDHFVMSQHGAMNEINGLLFKYQSYVDDVHRAPSYRCALELMCPQVHPVEAMPIAKEEKAKIRSAGVATLPSHLAVYSHSEYQEAVGDRHVGRDLMVDADPSFVDASCASSDVHADLS